MRLLAEIEMAAVLALSACTADPGQTAFQDRLFRFANAGVERAVLMEPARVHSPALCREFATPTAFVGPFRRVSDHARARDLCIRH